MFGGPNKDDASKGFFATQIRGLTDLWMSNFGEQKQPGFARVRGDGETRDHRNKKSKDPAVAIFGVFSCILATFLLLYIIYWLFLRPTTMLKTVGPQDTRAWDFDHDMMDMSPQLDEIRSAVQADRAARGIDEPPPKRVVPSPPTVPKFKIRPDFAKETMEKAAAIVQKELHDESTSRKSWARSYKSWFISQSDGAKMILDAKFFYGGAQVEQMEMFEDRRKMIEQADLFEIDFLSLKNHHGLMMFNTETSAFSISWGGNFFMEFNDDPFENADIELLSEIPQQENSACEFEFSSMERYVIMCHTRPFDDKTEDDKPATYDGFKFSFYLELPEGVQERNGVERMAAQEL